MYHLPEHYHNLSLRLSEVLDDIGVNERMVKNRRRSALLHETAGSLTYGTSLYIFGSKSEGTTTWGLKSDQDELTCIPGFNVIQDYAEWKPGHTNLLMIQDDTTSPGYCHLQQIKSDMCLPATDVTNEHCFKDAHGRILFKNTIFDKIFDECNIGFRNGPARTKETPGFVSSDIVYALSCKSWPIEARDWSQRSSGNWPTVDMKRYVENSGCFVVPVGSKVSHTEYLEWRISTTRAERCLMFNLNITQIRCFVFLKMILKRYLQPPVSSYMCKTVLLRCIGKTHHNMWQENNLLTCLTVCLHTLYCSILHKSCPHYFIPGNNLMARQFSPRMKEELLKSLHHVLKPLGAALYGIQTDDLGGRLKIKMNPLHQRLEIKMNPLHQSVQRAHVGSANDTNFLILGAELYELAKYLSIIPDKSTKANNQLKSPLTVSKELKQAILIFLRFYKNGTKMERKTLQLIVPFYCSSLGSVLASVNIGTNHSVSPEALNWLSAGMNSDVSSGRLKLASVLYCAGDMLRAESILRETERLYHLDSVEPVCSCKDFVKKNYKKEYCRIFDIQNEKAINSVCAFCVRFSSAEIYSMPHELQYELFRSSEEERLHRDKYDHWMDNAVVDSLPFLYFLQYKTYGNLQSSNNQQRALEKLIALSINSDEAFRHRETALNLLGQCMKQENRLNNAVVCYTRSLNVRGTNNAARLHLCMLLADLLKNLH